MAGPYQFIRKLTNIGVGAENQALEQPSTLPVDSIYAPRYNVRHSMAPTAPGYLKFRQELLPVALIANGNYFAGTLALGALSPEPSSPGNG